MNLLFSNHWDLFLLAGKMDWKGILWPDINADRFVSPPLSEWVIYICPLHCPVQYGILPQHHLYLYVLTHSLLYFVQVPASKDLERKRKWEQVAPLSWLSHQFCLEWGQEQKFAWSLQDGREAGTEGGKQPQSCRPVWRPLKVWVETGILSAYTSSNCWGEWRRGSCGRSTTTSNPAGETLWRHFEEKGTIS